MSCELKTPRGRAGLRHRGEGLGRGVALCGPRPDREQVVSVVGGQEGP